MSFAQNLKEYFFSSNACRSNKENSSTQANQHMKKRLLAPIAQRIIGKYNSNPSSQQNLDTSCVSLNIVGQEIKDLGLNRRLNAHKVKKSLAFDKGGVCLSKRDSKENEMLIEDDSKAPPKSTTNVLGPLNRNLNKEAALPEVTKPHIMWNIKPKGPEMKELPPMSRSHSMLIGDNSLPPLAQGGSKMSLEDNSTKASDLSQQNISLSELKLNSNLMVCDYVDDIIKTLKEKDVELSLQNCLENHKISPSLRAKMVDWMIEVLCSYKCAEQTFFLAISIMDSFFKKSTVTHLSNDLHLVGVASMFIASKFEEIYPMRLSVLYEKVGHKKLSTEDIIRKESEIMQVLRFNVISATIHEFITNVLFQLGLKNVMNPELYAYLQRVCVYLSKANMYDYELLCQYKTYELAACTLFVAFKVTEQVDSSFPLTNMVEEVCQILGVKDDILYSCATKILALAKNFDKVFPTFKNLKKFHSIGTPEINVPLSERRITTEPSPNA